MASAKRHRGTVSAGGVDWHSALLAELSGPVIPPDAVCENDLISRARKSEKSVNNFLRSKVASGEYVRARGKKPGDARPMWYYWPAAIG